jgi:hypothetical protein
MQNKLNSLIVLLAAAALFSCEQNEQDGTEIVTNEGNTGRDIKVTIEKGTGWTRAPQIAVWAEDSEGNYVETLYVTKKMATQGWYGLGNIRRKETLPYWCYQRGVQYDDGLYLPTKDDPLPDAVTSATPQGSFVLLSKVPGDLEAFVVLAELNESWDYNDNYPDNLQPGAPDYSAESGQPSVVYAANIDINTGNGQYEMGIMGHGSTDGEDGNLYEDMSMLTTALDIAESISVEVGVNPSGQKEK